MSFTTKTMSLSQLMRLLVSILIIGCLLMWGRVAFCPLVLSFLLAILLLPIASFLENKLRFKRVIAAACAVIVMMFVVSLILYLVSTQLHDLGNSLPQLKQQLNSSAREVELWIARQFNIDIKEQIDYLQNTRNSLFHSGSGILGFTIMSLSSTLLFIVLVIFYTFFLLFYRRLLFRFLLFIVKPDDKVLVRDVAAQIQKMVHRYLIGLLLEMLIVSGTCCFVFWLIGIRYFFLFGMLIGLFNVIPYAGIFTALFITLLLSAVTASATQILLVIVTVVAMHLIDSNLILPFIVGSQVRVNALVALMGVIIGALLWHIPGMFLSIPVIAIFKIVFDRISYLKPYGYLLGADE